MPRILTLSRIYFLQMWQWRLWLALHTLLFPVGILFFLRVTGSGSDPQRLAAGAGLLSLATISINTTTYWIMTDRFERKRDLLMSLPIARYEYYAAIVLTATVQALIVFHILILAIHIFFARVHYSLSVIPVITGIAFSFGIIGLMIGHAAKDSNHGGFLMNLCGAGIVFICPVFYPASALPHNLAHVAAFIPHTFFFRVIYELLNNGFLR